MCSDIIPPIFNCPEPRDSDEPTIEELQKILDKLIESTEWMTLTRFGQICYLRAWIEDKKRASKTSDFKTHPMD